MKNYIVESVGEIPRVRDVTFSMGPAVGSLCVLLNLSHISTVLVFFSLSFFLD